MNRRSRRLGLAAALLALALSGCGEDSTPGTTTASEPLSPEVLASALVEPPDLGTGWSVTRMPDFPELSETGVVTAEVRPMLPQLHLCDEADDEAQDAVDALEWGAFRQLDLDTGALLMGQVTEITTPEVPTVLDDAGVEKMVRTMVDKLP